jgi:hypothetical protein
MILSPVNCSEKMSHYEREGGIEQERADEIDGVEPGGEDYFSSPIDIMLY